MIDKNGKEISVRGYIKGDFVFIRADHPLYTAEQLMRHEAGHRLIALGKINLDEVRARLKEIVGEENLDEVARLYEQAYADSRMTAEEIWEECVCDALGDINIFAGDKVLGQFMADGLQAIKTAAESQVKETNETRGPPKGKTSRETVDNYTEKEYNDYGWARYNEVISASESEDLRSKFAAAVSKQAKYPMSSSGEYMIAIGEIVHDKIAYMKGTIDNPVITRVLVIYEDNETELDKVRRDIYAIERRGIQQEAGGTFYIYTSASFSNNKYQFRSDAQGTRGSEQLGTDRGRDSKKTPRPKEYIFGEDGQVTEKHSRELDFIDYLNENSDSKELSNREILEGALETAVKSDMEAKKLAQYKEKIDKMKVTKLENLNAWRYLSMLGNPKTHIRNLVSNVAMKGTMTVKDAVAKTLEASTDAILKSLGKEGIERTKTWRQKTETVKKFAEQTAEDMQDVISGGGKYSETARIKEKRQIFKNKILKKLYGLNSDLLSKEDWWFKRAAFKNAFGEFLTANGIKSKTDIENNPKLIEKARQYALEQAQIATFQQYSWLANIFASKADIAEFVEQRQLEIKEIAESQVKEANETRGPPKGKTSRETVDSYTEKEYNDYGWARYNEVISASENADLRSKFAAAVSKQAKYPMSSSGEYMIAIGEIVHDKIAYMKGTIDNSVITRVLVIDENNETKLDEIRRETYALERGGIQQKTGGSFYTYTTASFGRQNLESRGNVQSQRYNDEFGTDRGRDSKQTPRPKEYIFGEDGQVIEKHSRELEIEYDDMRKWAITATDSEVLGGKVPLESLD